MDGAIEILLPSQGLLIGGVQVHDDLHGDARFSLLLRRVFRNAGYFPSSTFDPHDSLGVRPQARVALNLLDPDERRAPHQAVSSEPSGL